MTRKRFVFQRKLTMFKNTRETHKLDNKQCSISGIVILPIPNLTSTKTAITSTEGYI